MPDDTPQENSGLPALEKTLGIPQSGSDTSANAGGRSVGVFEPETVIDGKYKVLSVIGRGGMGTVYRVEQIFLRKEFALKTIHGEFNESAGGASSWKQKPHRSWITQTRSG